MDAEPRLNGASHSTRRARLLALSAMAALVWLLAARILGPPDLYSEDQPRTVSYTVDALVNGRWVLPRERGEIGATKPPLYNWIAAPFVAAGGYSNELAHKAPTLLALFACWLILGRLGRRLGSRLGVSIGWLAALMAVSNSTVFKVGYLARPDMLLCLWLLLGWVSATALVLRRRAQPDQPGSGPLALGFWLCMGLAALTKGPPAIVLVLYALLVCRWTFGSWRAASIFRWRSGLPLATAMFGAWLAGVALVDPDHMVHQLWYEEFFGRVTGLGSEGNRAGPIEFLYRLFHLPIYFVLRFLPWSMLAIPGIVALWTCAPGQSEPRWRRLPVATGTWLHGAALMVVLIIGVLSISTGKRPLYIAPALFPAALVASWWLIDGLASPAVRRFVALAPFAAALVLAVSTIDHVRQSGAPTREFGAAIDAFVHEAEREIDRRGRPVMCWNAGGTYVQSALGISRPEDHQRLLARLDAGETLLIIAGERSQAPTSLPEWLESIDHDATTSVVVESARLPRERAWPGRVTLYEVTPGTP